MPTGLGTALLLGLGTSAASSAAKYASSKAQADKDRELASQTARYSPWTGLKMDAPKDPSLGDAVAGGLGSGLALAQGIAAPSSKLTGLFGKEEDVAANPLMDRSAGSGWAWADPKNIPGYKPLTAMNKGAAGGSNT